MTIANFGQLKTAIADFLNREDLTAVVPTFVSFAEAQFNRKVRSWRQEVRSAAAVDVQYSDLPADFLQPIRVQVLGTGTSEVAPIAIAQMLQKREQTADVSGRPRYYAITAQGLELFPTPDAEYNLSLVYYAKIPALDADADTNWFLEHHPDAYVYGSLVHSAPYLKDDARIAVWAGLLAQAMNEIEEDDNRARYGGSGLVMRVAK